MLTLLDRYILKQYLLTFFGILFLFIPIGILASLAEKINKIIDNQVPMDEVIDYYLNFTLVLGNMLMPILLFLAIIFFTSRLTARTEVVAILSSGVSYRRFLRPYFIGATFVAILIFAMGNFLFLKQVQVITDLRAVIFTITKKIETLEISLIRLMIISLCM
jgi:lipopolysaccharide export system permease protein